METCVSSSVNNRGKAIRGKPLPRNASLPYLCAAVLPLDAIMCAFQQGQNLGLQGSIYQYKTYLTPGSIYQYKTYSASHLDQYISIKHTSLLDQYISIKHTSLLDQYKTYLTSGSIYQYKTYLTSKITFCITQEETLRFGFPI